MIPRFDPFHAPGSNRAERLSLHIITIMNGRTGLLLALLAFFTLTYPGHTRLDAAPAWNSIRTVHCTVRFRPGMDDLGFLAARISEESYLFVSDFANHQLTRTMTVTVWPAHGGPDAGDGCFTCDITRGVPIMQGRHFDITYPGSVHAFRRMMTHNMMHVFQYDMFTESAPIPSIRARSMPAWFAEGMAIYVSEHDSVDCRNVMKGMKAGGFLPGLNSLTGMPGTPLMSLEREGFFCIEYLQTEFGLTTSGEIIRDIRETGDFYKAVQIATGIPFQKLETGLVDYCKKNDQDLHAARSDAGGSGLFTTSNGGPGTALIFPSISPDGRKIAYMAVNARKHALHINTIGSIRNGDAVRMSSGADTELRLSEAYAYPIDNRITWTVDSRNLVLAGRKNDAESILFVDPDTGRVSADYPMPFSAVMNPSISRDGDSIVFSAVATVSTDIYIYNRSAAVLIRVTDDAFMDRDPIFGPDNNTVFFATNRNDAGDVECGSYTIVRKDIKNGKRTILVSNGYVNIQPSLSPDGKSLIFVTNADGRFNIHSIDLHSNKISRITDSRAGSLYPGWFPYGKYIVFTSKGSKGSEIVFRELADIDSGK